MGEELGAWVPVVDRIHELLAETVRTNPDVEARAALRSALAELEDLCERKKAAGVREAFAALAVEERRA